ncbi:hypothetical protein CRENBAI_014007, partial [Crenichthys baileyi]
MTHVTGSALSSSSNGTASAHKHVPAKLLPQTTETPSIGNAGRTANNASPVNSSHSRDTLSNGANSTFNPIPQNGTHGPVSDSPDN